MISIIAIIGAKRELGYNNKLLWQLPGDLRNFKKITSGHSVIMGRKTFESIGAPLPERTNIIITRNKNYQFPGCEIVNNVKSIINKYQDSKEEIFVIGGGMIYEIFLPFTKKLYLTLVNKSPLADTYFPDYSDFKKIIFQSELKTENNIKYKFLELTK